MTTSTPSALSKSIASLRSVLDQLGGLESALERAVKLVTEALRDGHKVLVCGNGGSAADAMHLATELVVRYREDRRAFPAICLNTSGGDLTAIGNDYGFDHAFARQVEAFGTPGDALIVFSTSGKSPSVVKALQTARRLKLVTLAFLGRDGGACASLADCRLIVPASTDTARIQEAHQVLLHTLCERVEQELVKK